MKKSLAILSVGAAWAAFASVPTVVPGSVSCVQDHQSRIVTITYDLAGDPGIVTLDLQTNGVSIGAANFVNITGDVNRKVQPGEGKTITWRSFESWPGHKFTDGSVKAVVTAWATNAPPDYLVIDTTTLSPNDFAFYPSAEAVPFGVTNDIYKTSKLVMRRIHATGVIWRMGEILSDAPTAAIQSYDVAHLVTLTDDYYLGIYEVTQKHWQNIYSGAGAGGSKAQPSGYTAADRDVHPVESIAWKVVRGDGDSGAYNWPANGHDVNNGYFLGKLRSKTKLLFDFPTMAQWEFACRAGTTGTNNVDGVSLDETSWNSGNATTSMPVGLKKPNAWGLYDMLGNVEELCLDRKGTTIDYNVDGTPIVDPTGPTATTGNRLRKGGGFLTGDSTDKECAYWCRPGASRGGWSQGAANKCMGFRLWCPAVVP